MTRLESLKAKHPEWCWNCGACDHESTGGICINSDSPVIAALVAALEEAEADAKSWSDQADDRADLAIAIGEERDTLRTRLAATERLNAKLREALDKHQTHWAGDDWTHPCPVSTDPDKPLSECDCSAKSAIAALSLTVSDFMEEPHD